MLFRAILFASIFFTLLTITSAHLTILQLIAFDGLGGPDKCNASLKAFDFPCKQIFKAGTSEGVGPAVETWRAGETWLMVTGSWEMYMNCAHVKIYQPNQNITATQFNMEVHLPMFIGKINQCKSKGWFNLEFQQQGPKPAIARDTPFPFSRPEGKTLTCLSYLCCIWRLESGPHFRSLYLS
ncbi:hypothetical protein BDZ91DRAFT_764326 [Kalaharituber pfeilii]|nr:hypothetical protein BDZ91DRAFT_764326 [Kalaharituber pfeilii]